MSFNSQQTWKYMCRHQWKHDNLINNKNGDIQTLYDFHISTCHKHIGVICSREWLIHLISPSAYENVFLSSHPKRTINPQHPSLPNTKCNNVQINFSEGWILLKEEVNPVSFVDWNGTWISSMIWISQRIYSLLCLLSEMCKWIHKIELKNNVFWNIFLWKLERNRYALKCSNWCWTFKTDFNTWTLVFQLQMEHQVKVSILLMTVG